MISLSPSFDLIVISPFWFSLHVYNNSDKLVFKLNTVESTCAVEFYTVVDTSRSPVHNNSIGNLFSLQHHRLIKMEIIVLVMVRLMTLMLVLFLVRKQLLHL